MFDTVIVRYGEIFLKSDYVRRKFEDILVANLKRKLVCEKLSGKVYLRRNRIYIESNEAEKVCLAIKDVFGIVSVSPAKKITASMDDIVSGSVELAKHSIKVGESFAVRAQRSGNHMFKSKDVEVNAGAKIVEILNAKVNLTNPDKTIYVEIRDDEAFVFDNKIDGLGGLPYGCQERVVCLLSTGIDSPVACFMMMRRGCKVSVAHLGDALDIMPVVERLESYIDEKIPVYSIPHKPVLEKITQHTDKFTCVLCKRFMHRAAELVAHKEGAYGIVTGENIGQVASQTLENLKIISCTKLPVYQPLIAFDKEEIIAYAKKIGTYEFAKTGRCAFVPDKPATRSDEGEIIKLESVADVSSILFDVEKDYILKK